MVAARAGAWIDDHLLPKTLAVNLPDDARGDLGCAATGEPHHHA